MLVLNLFCWRIFLADPTWKSYTDRYMEVMVEALVSRQSEVEDEFISLLLSTDGLRHPLLQGISSDLISTSANYQILKCACLADDCAARLLISL